MIEEYLDEMATIYKSLEYGILVAVNPDSKRSGNPYFKFYNNVNYNKATKVIRILFNKADYVVHRDKIELWKLNLKRIQFNTFCLFFPFPLFIYSGTIVYVGFNLKFNTIIYLLILLNSPFLISVNLECAIASFLRYVRTYLPLHHQTLVSLEVDRCQENPPQL